LHERDACCFIPRYRRLSKANTPQHFRLEGLRLLKNVGKGHVCVLYSQYSGGHLLKVVGKNAAI